MDHDFFKDLPDTSTPITASNLNNIGTTINVTKTGENLNNYKTDGIYYFGVNYLPQNIPSGLSNGWLHVMNGENLYVKQVFYRLGTANSNDFETYVRTYTTEWSSWKKYKIDEDTGWINCTTLTGTWNYAKIRRIGKIVFLDAYASSLDGNTGNKLQLPVGFIPPQQLSVYGSTGWISAPTIARWYISTNGYAGIDWVLSLINGSNVTENTWKRIQTSFFVD